MKEHNNRKKAKYFTNILIHTVFALNIVAMNTMVFQDYKKSQDTLCPDWYHITILLYHKET